jgi:hypothetical protein
MPLHQQYIQRQKIMEMGEWASDHTITNGLLAEGLGVNFDIYYATNDRQHIQQDGNACRDVTKACVRLLNMRDHFYILYSHEDESVPAWAAR